MSPANRTWTVYGINAVEAGSPVYIGMTGQRHLSQRLAQHIYNVRHRPGSRRLYRVLARIMAAGGEVEIVPLASAPSREVAENQEQELIGINRELVFNIRRGGRTEHGSECWDSLEVSHGPLG